MDIVQDTTEPIVAQVDDNTFQVATSFQVVKLDELQEELDAINQRLAELPDDAALLAWAKENYPELSDFKPFVERKAEIENLLSLCTTTTNLATAGRATA